MAKFEQGINGGFRGKVGTVVGYYLRGQWVMRGLPTPPDKRKASNGQRIARNGFAKVQAFLKPMLSIIRVGFRFEAEQRNIMSHNAAQSFHLNNAIDSEGNLDITQSAISRGLLPPVEQASVVWENEGLRFNWKNTLAKDHNANHDQVMLFAKLGDTNTVAVMLSGARRKAGTELLEIKANLSREDWHCWISFISDDRRHVANSVYLRPI